MSHNLGSPVLKQLFAYERRLQDLESHIDNMFRVGVVADVKFDSDLNRWFVKIADKLQGDGQSSDNPDQDPNFKSDWLPWKTFGHPTIKFSIPPKVGQSVQMHSPYGRPEMGVVEPYHNNPDAHCPSGDPDTFVMKIEAPTGSPSSSGSTTQSDTPTSSGSNKPLVITGTKDKVVVTLGNSTVTVTADTITHETTNATITTTGSTTVNAQKDVTVNGKSNVTVANGSGAKLHLADDGTLFLNS